MRERRQQGFAGCACIGTAVEGRLHVFVEWRRAEGHDSIQGVLAKGKYFTAIGQVVDSALSRILDDVLALPDIPEAESHRLSELSKILNALEGLFVGDDPAQVGHICTLCPPLTNVS